MARKRKNGGEQEPAGDSTPAKVGHNGIDRDKVRNFVSEIEELAGQKMRKHMAYMAECAALNGDINAIYDAAKGEGVPKKALRKVIKTRELERKVEAIRDDLEGDDQESYDQIRHALGDLADTPLGMAVTGDGEPAAANNAG